MADSLRTTLSHKSFHASWAVVLILWEQWGCYFCFGKAQNWLDCWIIECGFSLLVLCLVMWGFVLTPVASQLCIRLCQVDNHLCFCFVFSLPFLFVLSLIFHFLPLSVPWPHSQAGDPYTSRCHADRQHKFQREHQVGARLAWPGSQHPLPSSFLLHHAVLDLRRSYPDRSAAVPRLPAVPGAPDRPLTCGQREQQRQLLWGQRSRRHCCSRRWWQRRCRWRRRRRQQCGRHYRRRQPVGAAWLQPLGGAPQGGKRTRAGGRKH